MAAGMTDYWLYAVIAGMAGGNLWIWSRPERDMPCSDA